MSQANINGVAVSNKVTVIDAQFRITVVKPEAIPEATAPEVIFFGRSNVGKSSLLNKLCNRKNLARTSKQPGRTQALNFFDVKLSRDEARCDCTFVDAPGYGFAEVSRSTRKGWGNLMEAYLEDSQRYCLALLLVDSRRELKEEEQWIIDTVPEEKLFLVATKADKLSQKEMAQARKTLGSSITFVSSLKGTGIQKVSDAIGRNAGL